MKPLRYGMQYVIYAKQHPVSTDFVAVISDATIPFGHTEVSGLLYGLDGGIDPVLAILYF